MPQNPITIYWAGDLFNYKDLTGNVELAADVEKLSGGKYQVKLPQLSESNSQRTVTSIRDADLELLFSCDTIVANFDGTDLDSGTVVEFCFAKMLDMPAVLLRTDFRSGSDQPGGAEPWNLMCSGYPRTTSVVLHGMSLFHQYCYGDGSWQEKLAAYRREIACRVIEALDKTLNEKPLFPQEVLLEQYFRTVRAAGGTLPELFPPERVKKLVTGKTAKFNACIQ